MSLVKLMLSEKSAQEVNSYLERQGLPRKEKFHSTILYTEETPVFETPDFKSQIKKLLPITLNPQTYLLDVFEKNLVLRYNHETIFNVHRDFILEATKQLVHGYSKIPSTKFPILEKHFLRRRTSPIYIFHPHITLCKNFERNYRDFPVPEFSISLEELQWNEEF